MKYIVQNIQIELVVHTTSKFCAVFPKPREVIINIHLHYRKTRITLFIEFLDS